MRGPNAISFASQWNIGFSFRPNVANGDLVWKRLMQNLFFKFETLRYLFLKIEF